MIIWILGVIWCVWFDLCPHKSAIYPCKLKLESPLGKFGLCHLLILLKSPPRHLPRGKLLDAESQFHVHYVIDVAVIYQINDIFFVIIYIHIHMCVYNLIQINFIKFKTCVDLFWIFSPVIYIYYKKIKLTFPANLTSLFCNW